MIAIFLSASGADDDVVVDDSLLPWLAGRSEEGGEEKLLKLFME
jgi:hypothetical protein